MAADLVTTDWLALLPALAPAVGVLLVLALDAVTPRRRVGILAVAGLSLLVGLVAAVPGMRRSGSDPVRTLCLGGDQPTCLWTVGPLSSTLQLAALGAAIGALLILTPRLRPRRAEGGGAETTFPVDSFGIVVPVALLLTTAAGSAAVAAAGDLGSWLVALEIATVPTVALVGLRSTRASGGGALTLLMTSLFSFALLVVGAALWVVATRTATFDPQAVVTAWLDPDHRRVLIVATLVLLSGIGFKLSLVPFHAWTPQVFASAELSVTALLASVSKVAGLSALIVVIAPFVSLTAHAHVIAFVLGLLAVASMLLGTLLAFRQNDVVRLLAWSTVAQAGWTVLPLAALSAAGLQASAGYLVTYAVASVLAFAAVASVHPVRGSTEGQPALAAYRGMLRDHPVTGAALTLALLVLAGLPPGVIGLLTKLGVLRAVVAAGLWPLALAGVVAAVLGIAAYLRWLTVLFAPRSAGERPVTVRPSRSGIAVLVAGTAVLAVLSVAPNLLFGNLR